MKDLIENVLNKFDILKNNKRLIYTFKNCVAYIFDVSYFRFELNVYEDDFEKGKYYIFELKVIYSKNNKLFKEIKNTSFSLYGLLDLLEKTLENVGFTKIL